MRWYVDNVSTATLSNSRGPIHNSSNAFEINHGAAAFVGLFSNCSISKGIITTEAQHDADRDRWLGLRSASGKRSLAVASVNPPAVQVAPGDSGLQPFIKDQPANLTTIGSPASGSGGVYGAGALTSKWWRGSAESCAAGHPTGWTTLENQDVGAATVVVDCDTTTSASGGTSILFTADNGGLPKYAYVVGACQANWINQDVTLIAYGKTLTGTANCTLSISEYDLANCATYLGSNVIVAGHDPGATWNEAKGTMAAGAWDILTSSWVPIIRCNATGTAYTVVFDAVMALQAPSTFATDAHCSTDADADAICNLVDVTAPTPEFMTGTWEFTATIRSPIDGAVGSPVRQILRVPGTAGDNNKIRMYWGGNAFYCDVFDSAGVLKQSSVPAALNANTDYVAKMSKSTSGIIQCCFDGTCDATPGIDAFTDGIGTELIFGSEGGNGGEVYVQKAKFFPRLHK